MIYTISEVWSKGEDKQSLSYVSDNADKLSAESLKLEAAGYVMVKQEVEKLGGER